MAWSVTKSLDNYSETVQRFADDYMLAELESTPREDLSNGDLTVLHTPYDEHSSADNSMFEFGFFNSHHEDERAENGGLALEGSFYAIGRLELWGIESDNPELDVISYYKERNPRQKRSNIVAMPQSTKSTKTPFPGKEELETQRTSAQITSDITDSLRIEENNKLRTELYSSKSLTHRLDLVERGLETEYLTKLENKDRDALRETLEDLMIETEAPMYIEHV